MREFEVIPHTAIGAVQLGMTREEIRQILGKPSHVQSAYERWGIQFREKDYFFKNAFQVSYDSDMNAEFIEVSSESDYIVTLDGINVHASPPEKVIEAIRKYADPDEHDREYPTNIIFREIDLMLYREHGEKEHFDAIGIGVKGYTQAIRI
jgi:hypothetical protein